MGKDDREDEDRRDKGEDRRDEGEGRRGDGDERRDEWISYTLQPIANNNTTPYGFVIDHFAYWGIPLAGFPEAPQPSAANPGTAPRTLKVKNIEVKTKQWTGGDFTITATRTPPLFHAFHHKTDASLNGGNSSPFERRSERNIVERDYSPARAPLAGKGIDACVELFDATFNTSGRANQPARVGDIAFSRFDTTSQIPLAISDGYFEISGGEWDIKAVGPLNAIWFVIFRKDTKNLAVNRLGDDYRLWHHRGETGTTHGYDWRVWQKNNFKQLRIEVRLSGELNAGLKESPDEDVRVSYELEWD